jgi:hypothetical protein
MTNQVDASAMACALCGAETVCRMEVARRMRPLCPDCIAILTVESEAEALACGLLAGPDPLTVN